MTEERKCEICGTDISDRHPQTKTCSDEHKQQLALRNRNARNGRRNPQRRKVQRKVLEAPDEARDVLREELRTFINREALTEDVLAEIKKLVGLAPPAIRLLSTQLDSEDEVIAQRAAGLILKYTLGNASVAPEAHAKQPAQMQVVFGMPDRNVALTDGNDTLTPDEGDVRVCNDCHQAKPEAEFVGKSDRCQECFDRMQRKVREDFAPKDPTRP